MAYCVLQLNKYFMPCNVFKVENQLVPACKKCVKKIFIALFYFTVVNG